jgi:hypothetical protein
MFHEYNNDLEESARAQDRTMERKLITVGRFKTVTHRTQMSVLRTDSLSASSFGILSGAPHWQSESADRG